MATSDAPVEIGHIALTVRDLAGVGDYYQRVIGLAPLGSDGETLRLGVGDRLLLELRRDAAARPGNGRGAGLFHTAFLLPARDDLSRWLRHIAESRAPIQGAADHEVSEALYLADPEGNGIEVYVDRPRATWSWAGGEVKMGTEPLDLQELLVSGGGSWTGAPEGTVVGHVHLQTGALPEAEAFYAGSLGFDITNHYRGATFYSSGGYHHHLATNIWNSRNAPPRSAGETGLAEVVLHADAAARDAIAARAGAEGARFTLTDPWNIPITIETKGASDAR